MKKTTGKKTVVMILVRAMTQKNHQMVTIMKAATVLTMMTMMIKQEDGDGDGLTI